VKNFHISLNRPLGPLGVTSCSRTHADITFLDTKTCSCSWNMVSQQTVFRNKFRIFLYWVRTIPFHSCRLKFYPEHRSYKPRQRMQTFRTKFYLRLWSILTRRQGSSAPVHHSDITFEILKGTLRACLYADFWFLRHSDITSIYTSLAPWKSLCQEKVLLATGRSLLVCTQTKVISGVSPDYNRRTWDYNPLRCSLYRKGYK